MKHRLFALAALLMVSAVAQADVVGTVRGESGRIDLDSEPGICMGDALKASFVPPNGKVVPGCWTAGNGLILVVFLDGDIAKIPMSAIKSPDKS